MKNKIVLAAFIASMTIGSSSVFAALSENQSPMISSQASLSVDGDGNSESCVLNPFCRKK